MFVGQLPYDATSEQIREHFVKGGVTGKIVVRLLTKKDGQKRGKGDKGDTNSRGMAFVECEDAEQQFAALALHRSYFPGADRHRQINVERTTGGGKKRRREKVDGLRENQKSYMKVTITMSLALLLSTSMRSLFAVDERLSTPLQLPFIFMPHPH